MGLSIIYGSSLSDKSGLLYDRVIQESIEHPEKQYIIIVPEQGSLMVQREMMLRHPRYALSNIDILSFQRLAYRVFQDLNLPMKNILDDLGKRMLLRLVVEKNMDQLTVFRRNAEKTGFIDQLKSMLSEFTQYNVQVENMQENVHKMERYPMLCGKLKDLSTIYASFLEMMHENYMASEELFSRLAQVLSQWKPIKNTVIAFDEFTGFTPLQYQVVEEIIALAPEIYLGAVLGQGHEIHEDLTEDSLFSMTKTMVSHVSELAIRHSRSIQQLHVPSAKGYVPEMYHLEENLFAFPKKKYGKKVENIRIVQAPEPSQEVAGALGEVLAGVRDGLTYGEMAVICGDPQRYQDMIEEQFTQAQIPIFMDRKASLQDNVLFRLIQDVLLIFQRNYDFDSMFAYLKNPLLGYDYELVGALENYALALGIRGKSSWKKEFTRRYHEFSGVRLPLLNQLRQEIIQPLLSLEEQIQGKEISVTKRLTGFVLFLEHFQIAQKMEDMAQEMGQSEELVKQREYEKAYEKLMNLFDSMNGLLGEKCFDFDTFAQILQAGIEDLKMGIAPPTLDCLVVGDLMRTRLGKIKKLIVLGANEGVLPPVSQGGGLLSDSDRELLSETMELSPTAREESFYQRFYLYLLLTKPTQSLSIYYSSASLEGKAMLPSFVIHQLKTIFPTLEEIIPDPHSIFLANTPKAGLALLALGMSESAQRMSEKVVQEEALTAENADGEPSMEEIAREEVECPWWGPLYQWYAARKEFQEDLRHLERGLAEGYREEALDPEIARKLFGDPAVSSTTRLENYAGCAYAHFLTYGLGLLPRQEYQLQALDYGNLFHDSIEEFFRLLQKEGKDWNSIDEGQRYTYVEESVRNVAESYGNDILMDTARNQHMVERVLRMTDRTLWALSKQWKQGSYTQTFSEVEFSAKDDVPDLRLPIGEGIVMALQGRIDRMDWSADENKVYVKIIDYKSGKTTFDFTRIKNGLQLQLLLYMEAAKQLTKNKNPGKEVIPAGLYYYHIDDPLVDVEDMDDSENLETVEKELYEKLRLDGISNADPKILARIDSTTEKKSSVINHLERDSAGFPMGRSVVTSTTGLDRLGTFVKKKAQELGQAMVEGKIPVNPYDDGQQTACDYCQLKGVCGFDTKLPGYEKKRLKTVKGGELTDGDQVDEGTAAGTTASES